MDLAVGAKDVFVIMELMTKTGTSKLVSELTYPVTGLGCVTRVYTELAIFDLDRKGNVRVTETYGDVNVADLRDMTHLDLIDATD
jgi:3-oxoadipate CoA-transferase beta subunit